MPALISDRRDTLYHHGRSSELVTCSRSRDLKHTPPPRYGRSGVDYARGGTWQLAQSSTRRLSPSPVRLPGSLEKALQGDEKRRAVMTMPVRIAWHNFRVVDLHLHLRITGKRTVKRIE